jgi:hypothetical protein
MFGGAGAPPNNETAAPPNNETAAREDSLQGGEKRCYGAGPLRALSLRLLLRTSLALTTIVALLGTTPVEAKSKKKDASSQKKKGKSSKGGSMDDNAGQTDGDLAPGSDDAKAKQPSASSSSSSKEKKTGAKPAEAAPVEAAPLATTEPAKEEPPAAPPPEPEPEPEGPHVRKNWISFGVQQDALFYTPVSGVCDSVDADGDEFPGNPQYSCRDSDGIYEGTVYSGAGNTIQSGIGLATTRIYVGYDRVFIDRLTIGGRLGYAFGGAPTVVGGGTFNPLHAELRSAFFFGDKPFERMGFRPYASLGVGIGEIDGKVSVDFFVDKDGYEDGERGQLDAWRITGTAFGALGLGVGYPIGPLMPTLEMRTIMMFGEPAFAMALAGNIAYGI